MKPFTVPSLTFLPALVISATLPSSNKGLPSISNQYPLPTQQNTYTSWMDNILDGIPPPDQLKPKMEGEWGVSSNFFMR